MSLITYGLAEGGGDDVSPVVANVTPTSGTTLASPNTSLQFDVTDLDPGVAGVLVFIKFTDAEDWLLVADGGTFFGRFDGYATRSTITSGYHYVIKRRGGWPPNVGIQLRVRAFDSNGNELE